MNSKERLSQALKGQPGGTPVVAPCYLELYLEKRILNYYLAAYESKLGEARTCAIDHAEDVEFRVEAIYQAYQLFHEQPDWMHVPYAALRSWAEGGCIERLGERLFYKDLKTGAMTDLLEAGETAFPTSVRFLEPASTLADSWQQEHPLRTQADIDAETPVRSMSELWNAGMFDVARAMVQRFGAEVYLRCETGTPYWNTYTVLGFERMMTAIYQEPKLFRYVMERKHAQRLELLKGFAAAGIPGVWVEECLASADLISKRTYETYVYPTTLAYLEDVKALGLDRILYFCGDVLPRLPRLRTLPIDAIVVEESKKGFSVSIADVIREVDGACCVFGNVDSVNTVQLGSAEEICREVEQQLELGRAARGFVMCQGSPFPLETEPAKVDIFIEAAHRTH